MKTSDFYYDLPEELIAQFPLEERSSSRLLHVENDQLTDLKFLDIVDLLHPDDLLVFNNTQVIPARLYGTKSTGGKIEILIERLSGENTALAHIKASKSPKEGAELLIEQHKIHVTGRDNALFELQSDTPMMELLEAHGHIPLPPYIDREDQESDFSRYQTLYGKIPGAVAAPTAGLHFDDAILTAIKDKGIETAEITLHVGAGTFQPVRVDDIENHHMHSEVIDVPESVVGQIKRCKDRGGRVVAVGTTTVRSLESAAKGGDIKAFKGETDIFIYPGYQYKVIDALITNFHLPESTLLMLVSALSSRETMLRAYQHAITEKYRFFSYGDAMFIS